MAERSLAHIESRLRPTVLWGGRLDYQKRFDILVEVAARMPDVDFLCWGLAVLDAQPDMATLSRNIRMNGPFKSPTDLPLEACDGWLFTSAWEGMPNILIELATLGVPIVASSVGAVPYLIDAETGWPVDPDAGIDAYVDAVRDMLSNPARRVTKAIAAQARAVAMFSPEAYDRTLAGYLARTPGDIAI
jgi:glycosyltransferase involved in cell wall biosynthesis